MLPYSEYTKPRLLFDTFYLIKSGQATNKKELASLFETSEKTISNYIKQLNSDFQTLITFDEDNGRYIIEHEGTMGLLKRNYPITADDVMIIISTLMQSQSFMETKMSIIKNSLLSLLPEEESKKLKEMLHFEKTNNYDDQNIEFNMMKIRKAITEEKKITFNYKSYEGKRKNYKIVPYSFAYDLGKFYIIGKPEDKDFLMHLRIDRIGDVQILQEEGKRLEEFNVYNYLKKTWYMYGGSEIKVLVRFKNTCKKVVTERNMVEGRIIEEDENYFKYEFICNGTKGIKLWLLGFGGQAEILEPVELREEMKEIVQNMIKVYGI
ncbi:WYL domain-containing protein [Clostridium sp. HMP27]|uniref:helix-turn-helix transcriptional regulator n=1 Tax=Clostridium sp. HMP27 TaxID=1487921 RepID=UPI00052BA50D|nr:WYL domain-containing protein [Clostridium sp. HMP27]KGK86571.1 hypothetical protein DP68_13265 [Clostridium sp. HMP27]